MTKLWGTDLNKQIEEFTVGNDFVLDKKLLKYDCMASIAHSKMLKKIGILKDKEQKKIEDELNKILSQGIDFDIKQEDEDCHTAIENHLTKKLGKLGKKIHTARSRNDQIKAALHLYMKYELNKIGNLTFELINNLKSVENIKIPGYTHSQKAMPSSFKLWADAFIFSLDDDLKLLETTEKIINQNPLGTGAGYGIPIKVDREITKKELNFEKNQETCYVQNSRGKFEALTLNLMTQIMMDLNKISSDLILFNMQEFSFVKLPDDFTTGSSIMPQKKNPDVLELIRAKYSIVLGYEMQVKSLLSNLISGYHRDFQLTKEPLMKGIEATKSCLEMMNLIIPSMKINKVNCKKAMTDELYATEKAYELVKKGKSFRDAYKEVKKKLK